MSSRGFKRLYDRVSDCVVLKHAAVDRSRLPVMGCHLHVVCSDEDCIHIVRDVRQL